MKRRDLLKLTPVVAIAACVPALMKAEQTINPEPFHIPPDWERIYGGARGSGISNNFKDGNYFEITGTTTLTLPPAIDDRKITIINEGSKSVQVFGETVLAGETRIIKL